LTKNLAIFVQNMYLLLHKFHHNFVFFNKSPIFSAENWRKSHKIVSITLALGFIQVPCRQYLIYFIILLLIISFYSLCLCSFQPISGFDLTSRQDQGCQMVYFQTKNPNLGKFWRSLVWKCWYIIWASVIFY
jgi:hypothetical protein